MALTNPKQLKIGDVVRFRTISPHDNVLWAGRIVSLCDYDTARLFQDIDTDYADVRRVNDSLAAKENLTYLVLQVQEDKDNEASIARRVFALEWIDVSSLEYIEENSYIDIRIYDLDRTKLSDVLKAISALGYVVEKRPD